MKKLTLILCGLSAIVAALSGCSDPAEANAVKTAPLPTSQMVDRIKNDPHMPEDQKQAALARIQSHPVPDKTTGGR
jgi:hypothetical protein